MRFAIVAVGYNRPDSMHRLLSSVAAADYDGDCVDIVVSIDKGERQGLIAQAAESLDWKNGDKTIRVFRERQGLRSHIVQCGDLTDKYDAVIVLEDDLLVAPYFYTYVKQAVNFYRDDDRIAGISLYKHQTHPGVNRPFEPASNGHDAYLQQFAMSWGQCWTRRMWAGFKDWYIENESKDLSEGNILPLYIARWNKQSWLKYYMRYIVETGRYFVYPYFSLATNASDVGEHCRIPNNDFQVSMQEGRLDYRFPSFERAVKYDVFFERAGIEGRIFPCLKGEKTLDLYGNRPAFQDAGYLFSTRALPYKVVEEIQLKYRPVEMNCVSPTAGKGIFVYDLGQPCKAPKADGNILTRYDVRSIHWKKLIRLGVGEFMSALRDKIMNRGK